MNGRKYTGTFINNFIGCVADKNQPKGAVEYIEPRSLTSKVPMVFSFDSLTIISEFIIQYLVGILNKSCADVVIPRVREIWHEMSVAEKCLA